MCDCVYRCLPQTVLDSWMVELTWSTHATLAGRCKMPIYPYTTLVSLAVDLLYRQERLQKLLRSDHDGELIVVSYVCGTASIWLLIITLHIQGEAVIIPAYPSDQDFSKLNLSPTQNEGKPIRYLISAPTMRIPTNVNKTVNAYLAFRAVLRAGLCMCVCVCVPHVCNIPLIHALQSRLTTPLTPLIPSPLFSVLDWGQQLVACHSSSVQCR